MLINEKKKIFSCNDFELEIKRETDLEYQITYPSDVKVKAIVFIIAGFGADTNSQYMDKLREYTAETYSVVAVNVFYHCFYARPGNKTSLQFDDLDIGHLKSVIKEFNIDFSDVNEITKEAVLSKLRAENKKIKISMTMVPDNNEYQNFGIMQAIDHLNVLKDLYQNLNLCNIPVICFGSSHGAYIAHMMSKISPHSIDHIVDNSSYVRPPLAYVVGKETNINEPEFILNDEKLILHCFVQSYWNTDINSKYCFSKDRKWIRDLSNKEHIAIMSKIGNKKTSYTIYHSEFDGIAPIVEKESFCSNLSEYGFDVTLHRIGKDDVDGRFIKSTQHGLDMSIKELVKRELPSIIQNFKVKATKAEEIVYKCDTLNYVFNIDNSIYKTVKL